VPPKVNPTVHFFLVTRKFASSLEPDGLFNAVAVRYIGRGPRNDSLEPAGAPVTVSAATRSDPTADRMTLLHAVLAMRAHDMGPGRILAGQV